MKISQRGSRDWPFFLFILLLGVLFMLGTGQLAIQLAPSWALIADVDSKINPNEQLALWSEAQQLEPVNAGILTQPAWRSTFLTPGAPLFIPPIILGLSTAALPPGSETPQPPIPTPAPPGSSATPVPPIIACSSTPVIIIFPTSTTAPKTDIPTEDPTSVPTATPTATLTATVMTATTTVTETITAKPTLTMTPTATSLPACKTTINLNSEPNPHSVSKEMTCFTYTDPDPFDPAYNDGAILQIASTDADGNIHEPGGCPTKGLIPGSSIDYGATNSGGVITFRINVTTAGSLDIFIADWTTYPACPP